MPKERWSIPINIKWRRFWAVLGALLLGLMIFWPAQHPGPNQRIPLGDLLGQASSGPLLAPDGMLGSFECTPFLPHGWGALSSEEFRCAVDTQRGAWVRFYLSHKVALSVDLEGRSDGNQACQVSLALAEQPLRVLKEFELSSPWSHCQVEIPVSDVGEGLNQLVIVAKQRTYWRKCQIRVQHAPVLGAQGTAGKEPIHLAFGRSLELPVLLQPSTSLIIDDVQPWIEPGAPSLDSPWDLMVRLQSGEGLDLSWHLGRSGPHKIRFPNQVPTQVTLSLLATTPAQVVAGQSGLSLRSARLEGTSVALGATPMAPPHRPEELTSPPGRAPNIVLYVVDTLRADRLHCYGYPDSITPQFDALSRDGVRFADCVAQSSWTKAAMGSIMTSLLPDEHGAEDFPDVLSPGLETLAQVLGKAGFDTAGMVANPFVGRGFGFAKGFAVYQEMPEMEAHALTRKVLSWLDRRRAGPPEGGNGWGWGDADRPFFLYVHALDPHMPYSPPPRFRPPGCPPSFGPQQMKKLREAWEAPRDGSPAPTLVAQLRQAEALHRGEIASCDEAFGQFVSYLKTRGLYDNTLIVLVSDHGEQFFEHNLCDHMNSLYQEVLHVPLIIKFPHNEGAGTVVKPAWQHIDIAPTLLRRAGVAIPASMQGLAYVPGGPEGRSDRPAHFSLHVGAMAAQYKQGDALGRADTDGVRIGPWILNRATSTIADVEPIQLFNLDTDPAQKKNLAYDHPEVRTWLTAWLKVHARRSGRPTNPTPNPALPDAMRALQYLR